EKSQDSRLEVDAVTPGEVGNVRLIENRDGDAVAIGQGDRLLLVEDDGPAGLDGQDAPAGPVHRLDGRAANRGHVEAHVLLRLGHLDDDEGAGAAQLAGTGNGAVGPLDSLDGQHAAILDHDAL